MTTTPTITDFAPTQVTGTASAVQEAPAMLWPRVNRVAAPLVTEVAQLRGAGVDVDIVDQQRPCSLPNRTQQRVDAALHTLVRDAGFAATLFDPSVHPAGAAWWGVSKRAVALHTIHRMDQLDRPGQLIPEDAYDVPLLAGGTVTARNAVYQERSAESAERILERYDALLAAGTMDDNQDSFGLTTRDYLVGTLDSHAVRTRAEAALSLLHERLGARRDLSIVGLGCAAADPLMQFAETRAAAGKSTQLSFVDHDPMALATVAGVARTTGHDGRVSVHRRNLLSQDLRELFGTASVDVVELLGIFEHLPASKSGYRIAAAMLARAASIVRPGGLILLGNMVPVREQQAFFDGVWPALHQRSIGQTLRLIAHAGFPADAVRVRVPQQEGVYAVYAIEVPERRRRGAADRTVQRALGRLLTARMPSYA